MKALLLFAGLLIGQAAMAQVGIGTSSPSANAVLDVASTTKGLMLPRLDDTTTVRNPSAGLMIYSKQAKAPAFHNGAHWNSLATSGTAAAATGANAPVDSVTYTITGGTTITGFTNGAFRAVSIGHGLSNVYALGTGGGAGKVVYKGLLLTKVADANSIGFIRSINTGRLAVVTSVEFKVYAAGATTPTYSIKLTSPYIISYDVAASSGTRMLEQIAIGATTIGYKEWKSGLSTGWNLQTNVPAPY